MFIVVRLFISYYGTQKIVNNFFLQNVTWPKEEQISFFGGDLDCDMDVACNLAFHQNC